MIRLLNNQKLFDYEIDVMMMFEKRSKEERTYIYVFIALLVTLILSMMHYYLMNNPIELVMIIAAIEFFVIFYILYLPLKYEK